MAVTIVFRPKNDPVNIFDNPMDAVLKAHEIAKLNGQTTFSIERGVKYTNSIDFSWTSMGTFDVPPDIPYRSNNNPLSNNAFSSNNNAFSNNNNALSNNNTL